MQTKCVLHLRLPEKLISFTVCVSFLSGIYTQRQLKVTSKSHTLNIEQYLVHSERRTAGTSALIFME